MGVGPGGARTIGTFSGGGQRFGGGGGGWHGGQRPGGGGWNHGRRLARWWLAWRRLRPALCSGAIIGSGLAASSYYGNSYGYYGGSPYYGSSYYDDAPDVVEVAPDTGAAATLTTASAPTSRTMSARAPISVMTACVTPARNTTI